MQKTTSSSGVFGTADTNSRAPECRRHRAARMKRKRREVAPAANEGQAAVGQRRPSRTTPPHETNLEGVRPMSTSGRAEHEAGVAQGTNSLEQVREILV